jgi:hypothetical protein
MFKLELLANEKVTNIYRQTEIVLLKPVLIIFILIYLPWYFLLKYELAATYDKLILFWTLLVFLYGLNQYFLWLLNVYLVTDRRVVKVNYKSVFNKEVLESPLDRILNVSFSVKGFWAALFGFGNVEVQVTGLPEPMELKNVSHPAKVKDILWKTYQNHSRPNVKDSEYEAAQRIIIHKNRVLKTEEK